ncbi:MAG: TA0956 family protein [Candidatus Thermoplasmatota archaeon]|nr:TA0956 family protein [Candidatus Thermoplasmatota archaeon]
MIYNISLPDVHTSTICVEIAKLCDSITSLPELFRSEYASEVLSEFISKYSRTETVMPDDHTIGFVVVNTSKKVISISLGKPSKELKETIRKATAPFEKDGIRVELDID